MNTPLIATLNMPHNPPSTYVIVWLIKKHLIIKHFQFIFDILCKMTTDINKYRFTEKNNSICYHNTLLFYIIENFLSIKVTKNHNPCSSFSHRDQYFGEIVVFFDHLSGACSTQNAGQKTQHEINYLQESSS